MTQEIVDWWGSKFDRFDLLPKDICSRLVDGLPFARNCTITEISIDQEIVRAEIEGYDRQGEVFFTGRSVEFVERQVHLNTTGVVPRAQGQGYGRLLARNCYRLARELDLDRLGVTAIDAGAYTWARAGFLPTFESWNFGRCKERIVTHMVEIPEIDWETRNNIYRLLGSDEQRNLWDVADLEMPVMSAKLPETEIPLGRALLAESNASWKGTVEFYREDDGLLEDQLDRARDYLGLGPEE
ncbi:GNAT family N-acetyltransferase [Rhizobium sp. BR 317]|uniref:hypothetical protein n=1 Tax=Rhizobium sp. BR 317 TaxID=3040015 RepID=UPI0039BEE1FA